MLDVLLLVGALAVGAQQADTTVEVRQGDRLVVEGLSGELAIRSWDQDVLEVVSEPSDGVIVRRSGSVLTVESRGRRRSAEATIRVPRWLAIRVESRTLDVFVRGVDGALEIANVAGDVSIADAGGPVDVRSVAGEILVVDARAGVRASSQADDVTLRRVQGPVEAHSGDGDLVLIDVSAPTVRAETQDGDVVFSGEVADDGEYGFYVHDGDASIALPEASNATVRVSTFDGEFQSDFTVRVDRFTSGRQFDFVLGQGGARIEIEVFDGDIRLLRRP